jgi:crotonobetainyl-CoA:carnitine CoA-transferase CaiB-like acyl-CoA transferase
MYDILEGVRVVDLSMYAFGPAAAAVLGDWGADVIKVVHPKFGDPMRAQAIANLPKRDDDLSFMWEILNRNKRSVAIDVATEEGRALLDELIVRADVFLTNLLPPSRRNLRVEIDDVRAVNHKIIYARATGQGARGPEAEKGGFDHTSYWCRSGIAHAVAQSSPEFIPQLGPAFGDLASAFTLASGVVGALYRRERTGKPAVVDASLLNTGLWMLGPGVTASDLYDVDNISRPRHADLPNPLVAAYESSDGRHVYLAGVRTDGDWENFCTCIDRLDLLTDERFATGPARIENRAECIATLDEIFAAKDLAHWRAALDDLTTPWSVVQTAHEVHDDVQVEANGYLVPVMAQGKTPIKLVASPVQFDEEPPELRGAPEHGEHTEEILLELGHSWDEIAALKEQEVIN